MHFLFKDPADRCDFKDPADRTDLEFGFVHVVGLCSMTYSIFTMLIFCGSTMAERGLHSVGFAFVQDSALPVSELICSEDHHNDAHHDDVQPHP